MLLQRQGQDLNRQVNNNFMHINAGKDKNKAYIYIYIYIYVNFRRKSLIENVNDVKLLYSFEVCQVN